MTGSRVVRGRSGIGMRWSKNEDDAHNERYDNNAVQQIENDSFISKVHAPVVLQLLLGA